MPLQPDVSDLTADVSLGATPFTIYHYQHQWVNGEWVRAVTEEIPAIGIVRPIATMYNSVRYGAMKVFDYYPEGYIEDYSIEISSKTEMFLRDEIVWKGQRFTVASTRDWNTYGWNSVICKLLTENDSTGGGSNA